MGRTTISVSDEVADELHSMKHRGESYDDVLRRVINVEDDDSATESPEEAGIDTSTPTPDVDRSRIAEALAGSGDILDRRVDAIVDMYEYLRAEGEATKSELLAAVDVEATGYASEASVWSNMIKGKATLSECPGVEPPRAGMSTWRYSEAGDV